MEKLELFWITFEDGVNVEKIEEKDLGEWDEVRWKEGLKLGLPISRLIEDIMGWGIGTIAHKSAYQFFGNYCSPSICFFKPPFPNVEIDHERLGQAIAGFSTLIFSERSMNLSLFDAALECKSDSEKVRKHATQFIRKNQGGKLNSPVRVASKEFEMVVSGSFTKKPDFTPSLPKILEITGRVITLFCEEQNFVVRINGNEVKNIRYLEREKYSQLRSILGDPIYSTFKCLDTHLVDGKPILILKEFEILGEILGPLI